MAQLTSTEENRQQTAEGQVHALELLKSQHREVEELFAQIEATSSRAFRARTQLFEELALKLNSHAKIEEKMLYPEGREIDEDQALEAYEEHDVVRNLMKKISKTDPKDETYMAKITVLKEIVQHHVKEEEEEFFKEIEASLGTEHLLELGEEMQAMFEKLVGGKAKRKPKNLQ